MREKLIGLLDDALLSVNWDSHDYPDTDSAADILIANDVVPVVRCKNCINGIYDEANGIYKCVKSAEMDSEFGDYIGFISYHDADYYCADGDRRTDE